jgi:hypothetical protein
MPGLLENTIHQGYGYLDQSGYVDKARPFVEKARNAIPLIDQAAKKAEELVPPLITRADELADPTIQRMTPYVEPRIEQVKEIVTPYVNRGVENYQVIRDGGVKYYNAGLERVDKIIEFKEAKTTQIKDFTEAKATQIKEFTEPRVQQVMDIKDAKVAEIKGFANPPLRKIKDFAEPKVEKIKGAVEPTTDRVKSVLKYKKEQAQKLLRVPKATDLQGLRVESLLSKVASALESAEEVVDKYLPLSEEQQDSDDGSDRSCASDSSYGRINRSLGHIMSHFLFAFKIQIALLLSIPSQLKAAYADGTLKEKAATCVAEVKSTITSHFMEHFACLKSKARHVSKWVAENSLFKKALNITVSGSEKVLGKERTSHIQFKVASYMSKLEQSEAGPVAAIQTGHSETTVVESTETTLRKREGKKGKK